MSESGISVTVSVKDMDKLQKKMQRFVPALKKKQQETIRKSGEAFMTRLQFYASGGGGGPQVQTGEYLNSLTLTVLDESWRAYTNAPQARRLEYGFVGTDSLGRNYSQHPRPHWRPATEDIRTGTTRELKKLPKQVWRDV